MIQTGSNRRSSPPPPPSSGAAAAPYRRASRSAEERRSKIVDVAIKLARGRSLDAIGLREVADEAGVALGTLYKVFSSKEEIIGAAIELQTRTLRKRFDRRPAHGETRLERVEDVFTRLTRGLCKHPSFARAIISTITADHPEIFAQLLEHEEQADRIIIAALRGGIPDEVQTSTCSEGERQVTFLLRQIWFAGLVGWAGGLFSEAEVIRQVMGGAKLILAGAAASDLSLD